MKKVSVIIPVYNVEKYIAKCLESIMNQTLADFECLIVNDGTKDNSIEVAKEVTKEDKRFIYLDKENGGLSDARNFGLDKASGEYICFIDSDDYIDITTLEKTYNKAKENDSDICVFDMYYAYEDGRNVLAADNFEKESFKDNKEILFINNSANNKLFKRSFILDKRFIKGMWYEDLAVIPLWIAEANNVVRVKEPLYYYLQRSGSISHSADPRVFDIYVALSNIKDNLHLTSKQIDKLYFNNCLIMTTLRIRNIEDNKLRHQYYVHNGELLDFHYPTWYKDVIQKSYTFKQKIVFTILKLRLPLLLDLVYKK